MPTCWSRPSRMHGDAVAERHRLDLVVGDVDHRRARAAAAARRSRRASGRAAWRRGSTAARRAGTPRLADDRAAHRDPLALAARELPRLAVEELVERPASRPPRATRGRSRPRRPCAILSANRCSRARSCAGRARSPGRPSRRRGPAAATSFTTRPPMRSSPSVMSSRPAIIRSSGRLAAARRPDQHHQLAVGDLQRQVLDRLCAVVESLRHMVQDDFRHSGPPLRGPGYPGLMARTRFG